MEEQQSHLNKGLVKLEETESIVSKLGSELKVKRELLIKKEKEATETMTKLMDQKQKAEDRKQKLEKLDEQLKVEKVQISEKSEIVQAQLDQAGPALEKAKRAVGKITKNDIRMIKSLNNPPINVKVVMTAIVHMLTGKKQNWKGI